MRQFMLQRRELLMPFPSMPSIRSFVLYEWWSLSQFPLPVVFSLWKITLWDFFRRNNLKLNVHNIINLNCLINCPAQTLNNSPSDLTHSLKFLNHVADKMVLVLCVLFSLLLQQSFQVGTSKFIHFSWRCSLRRSHPHPGGLLLRVQEVQPLLRTWRR